MSYKTSLIKLAIKLTPKSVVLWVANKILKDIAELKYFSLDIDTRKSYVEVKLLGESESIEVWLEEFYIVNDQESYSLVIQKARSNKPWLNNLLSRIVGKTWKIPETPQYKAQIKLISELFEPKP
jgi:hypothetical protein